MNKSKYKTDYVVLKHDDLRELTKSLTSIDEQRLVNSCLTLVHQGKLLDSDLCYKIDVANYAEKNGISEGMAYTELKKMLDYHFKAAIDIPQEGTSILRTHIILEFKYDDTSYNLEVKFHKEVIPLLSGHMPKGTYSYFDVRMDAVPSNRRYLMGELVQRNMWKFTREESFILSIQEVRSALNLKDNEYPGPYDIVRRIITPTMGDIAEIMGRYINFKKKHKSFIFTEVSKEEFGKVTKERVEPNNLHENKNTVQVGMIFSSLAQLFHTLQIGVSPEDRTREFMECCVSNNYKWEYLKGTSGKVKVLEVIFFEEVWDNGVFRRILT
jgi:hypothetical protein